MRDMRFTVYLSEEEYAKIQVLAAAYGLPMSAYIRTIALGDALGQSFADIQMLFKQSQDMQNR
jgi:predicted DNA binding CopG/RHH family protein